MGHNDVEINPNNFVNLSAREKKEIEKLAISFGMTLDTLKEDRFERCCFNILVYLMFYDKEVKQTVFTTELF